jgi:hypothetical protein
MNLPPNTDDYIYVRGQLPKQFIDNATAEVLAELPRKPVTVGSDAEQRKVVGNVRRVEGNEALIELDNDQLRIWRVRKTFAGQIVRVGVVVRATVGNAWKPLRVLGLRILDNLTETASDDSPETAPPRPMSLIMAGGSVIKLPRPNTSPKPTSCLLDKEALDKL